MVAGVATLFEHPASADTLQQLGYVTVSSFFVGHIELNCFDPISRIYPHDPPREDRANEHIGALYCQMADVL